MRPFAEDEILMKMCDEYAEVMREFVRLYDQYDLKKEDDSQSFKECIDGIDDMTRILFARISFNEKFGAFKN